MTSRPPTQWFREPWVWLLIALPASAVVGGVVTIWIAIASSDGLVEEAYRKEGLAVHRLDDRPSSD